MRTDSGRLVERREGRVAARRSVCMRGVRPNVALGMALAEPRAREGGTYVDAGSCTTRVSSETLRDIATQDATNTCVPLRSKTAAIPAGGGASVNSA